MRHRRRPGKLIAAARHWARAKPPDESESSGSASAFGVVRAEGYVPPELVAWDADGDSRAFGFPLEDGKKFPVWEDNELAIRAFLKVRTQWIRDSGLPTGLDGAAVESKVKRFARVNQLDQAAEDAVFESIDLMEAVIVAEWAKAAERRAREMRSRAR